MSAATTKLDTGASYLESLVVDVESLVHASLQLANIPAKTILRHLAGDLQAHCGAFVTTHSWPRSGLPAEHYRRNFFLILQTIIKRSLNDY